MGQGIARLAIAASLGVALASAATARAEEEVDLKRYEAGVGIGYRPPGILSDGSVFFGSGADLLVPFRLGALRLEPALGLSTMKASADQYESSSTSIEGGVGVFYGWSLDHRTAAYVGSRFGIGRNASSTKQTLAHDSIDESSRQMMWFVAPGAGAEVYLSPSFSLGGEIALAYARTGTPEVTSNVQQQGGLIYEHGWSLHTRTLIVVRLYFWKLE